MSEPNSNFDDELISAYLDDELSPQERARVEERLAADPKVRQLLDELRSVSQAMQGLPAATLGTDLREAVIRRAERAMLVSTERASARGQNGGWKLPFGRSKRAWLWAGAAIAAGLLLMVFQQMPGENRDLPRQVAFQDHVESDRSGAATDLKMRALGSPGSPPGPDSAGSVIAVAPATGPVAGSESTTSRPAVGLARSAGGASAPALESTAGRDDVALDASGLRGGGASRRVSIAFDADKPDETADFAAMIVNVECNPEAMQKRTYEAVFEKNQLEVERHAADKAKQNEQPNVDVLVVEAAPAQVYSCIKAISDDQVNYPAINVEEQTPPSQNEMIAKKLTSDAQQYNRGRFQNQQQVKIAPSNNRYYYSTNQSGAELGSGFKVESQAESPPRDKNVLADNAVGQTQGAAMAKMSVSAAEPAARKETLSAANAPTPGVDVEGRSMDSFQSGELQENLARRASQKLATKAETLQVLFVFQCPTYHSAPAAGSAPTTSAPATAAPAKEGLKSDER